MNANVKAKNPRRAIIVGADPTLPESLTGWGPNTLAAPNSRC